MWGVVHVTQDPFEYIRETYRRHDRRHEALLLAGNATAAPGGGAAANDTTAAAGGDGVDVHVDAAVAAGGNSSSTMIPIVVAAAVAAAGGNSSSAVPAAAAADESGSRRRLSATAPNGSTAEADEAEQTVEWKEFAARRAHVWRMHTNYWYVSFLPRRTLTSRPHRARAAGNRARTQRYLRLESAEVTADPAAAVARILKWSEWVLMDDHADAQRAVSMASACAVDWVEEQRETGGVAWWRAGGEGDGARREFDDELTAAVIDNASPDVCSMYEAPAGLPCSSA